MKKTLKTLVLTLIAIFNLSSIVLANEPATLDISEKAVLARIMALENQYPTGTYWNDETSYTYTRNDGATYTSTACGGFAMMLEEAAFGPLGSVPRLSHQNFYNVRVGDLISTKNPSGTGHVAVVIGYTDTIIYIAHGNVHINGNDGVVIWNAQYSKQALQEAVQGINIETSGVIGPVITTHYQSEDTIAFEEARLAEIDRWQSSPTIVVELKMTNGERNFIVHKGGKLIGDSTIIRTEYTNSYTGFSYVDSADHTSMTFTFNGDTQVINIGETKTIGDTSNIIITETANTVITQAPETSASNTRTTPEATASEITGNGFTIISSPEYFRNCGIFLDGKSISAYKATRDHGMEFETNADKSITVTYKSQTYYVASGETITINK